MRARGHFIGGTVAAAGLLGVGALTGHAAGPHDPAWWGAGGTVLFFSLFPDVDTDSLPRRWFYRGVVLGLLWCAWRGEAWLGLWLAILAMLPLLDHHRGWTHGRWMPLLVPAVLGGAYVVVTRILPTVNGQAALGSGDPWWTARDTLFYVAAVVGWYTHLMLDGLFRLFPEDPD